MNTDSTPTMTEADQLVGVLQGLSVSMKHSSDPVMLMNSATLEWVADQFSLLAKNNREVAQNQPVKGVILT